LGGLCSGAAMDADGIARAARELVSQHKAAVVAVSMANEGAVLAAGNESWFIAAPQVTPVSQIGAGDCMVAAMTLALAAGAQPRDVLRHGVAGGTAAVLTPGTELLRRGDFEQLLAEIK